MRYFGTIKKNLFAGFSCILNILRIEGMVEKSVITAFKVIPNTTYLQKMSLSRSLVFKYKTTSFSVTVKHFRQKKYNVMVNLV